MLVQTSKPELSANLVIRGPTTVNQVVLLTGSGSKNIGEWGEQLSAAILRSDPLRRICYPLVAEDVIRVFFRLIPPPTHAIAFVNAL